MRLPYKSVALAFAAFALARAETAAAQTTTAAPTPSASHAPTPVPAGSALVRVSNCAPKNVDPKGGPGFIGYVPGQSVSNYYPDVYSNIYYQPSASTSGPTLFIAFTNISHKTMSAIEFGLLSNELLAGEARDTGTFSPGVEIKHKLGLSIHAIFPGSSRCVPLRVTFADGTTWRNPRLPKKGQAYFNSKIPPTPK
jgi:hypothetical protein